MTEASQYLKINQNKPNLIYTTFCYDLVLQGHSLALNLHFRPNTIINSNWYNYLLDLMFNCVLPHAGKTT